ncbi:hypothetical protein EDB84DRAFT_1523849, partial [Lactarius hengduanensis]
GSRFSPKQSAQPLFTIRFFITILQQMARADPMTALLSPAVGGSMQSQMEAKLASINLKSPGLKSTMLGSPSARTFNISAMNRQSLTFDSSSSPLQMPPIPRISNFCAGARLERRASSRPQSTDFSGLSWWLSAFRSPRADGGTAPGGLDGLSPAVGDSWASMVNMPLLPMFQKTSSNNSNNGQTVSTTEVIGNRAQTHYFLLYLLHSRVSFVSTWLDERLAW